MAYNKPQSNNISFKFLVDNYNSPNANNIIYNFGVGATIANLRSAINVVAPDRVKECPTIVVGFSDSGTPQILKLPCIYTGYRELGSILNVLPPNVNLSAYIFALANYLDLNSYIKSTIQAYFNLASVLYSIPPANLLGFIHGFDIINLVASMQAFHTKTLYASIATHLPADLSSFLNIIEVRNLPTYIKGEWWHGQLNLKGDVYRIFQRGILNIKGLLHGYATLDLSGLIATVYKYDLLALIQSTTEKQLGAFIFSIAPKDLHGFLHGFDIRFLKAHIIGGFGPGDIQAFINCISPFDLLAQIAGFKGLKIPFDLRAVVGGWNNFNLNALISAAESINLGAYLKVIGKIFDLNAKIIPKVIHVKRLLFIPLLEHKDLNAIVNFACFASTYTSLNAYLYAIYKKDLRASLWGWNTIDGHLDLNASINTELYKVEDKFNITVFPNIPREVRLNIHIKKPDTYTVFDTFNVFVGADKFKNLSSYINGTLRFRNLTAYINPIIQTNYSELPPYINPKTHEVVIKFDNRGVEKWRRFVELMFKYDGSDPYHYFYVSGSSKVYKVDRTRHWTIWAYSYVRDDDNMIERRAVRKKFIFNLKNYSTMDEAIRDLIDRVSAYREYDLNASIYSIMDKYKNLNCNINGIGSVWKHWVKYLRSFINEVVLDFVHDGYTPSSYDFNFE